MSEKINDPVFCSFCGKNRQEVRALVSGPCVFLCSECWEGAADVFATYMKVEPAAVYEVLKKEREAARERFIERLRETVQAAPGDVVSVGPVQSPTGVVGSEP